MEPLMITTFVLTFLVIVLAALVFFLHKRISTLSRGTSGKNLESIINQNHKELNELKEKVGNHSELILDIKKESMRMVQHIGVVRFNPFKEVGGSQSFAIALVNKHKNGVVISSLYARDRVNVFAKPINQGSSEYNLSKEEQQALNQALQN